MLVIDFQEQICFTLSPVNKSNTGIVDSGVLRKCLILAQMLLVGPQHKVKCVTDKKSN